MLGDGQGAPRHAVVTRLHRVLDDNAAAALLHRGAAQGGVIQRAAQHHPYRPRAAHERRAAEKRVGRGPDAVLPRPARRAHYVAQDEQVPIRRSHVDPAASERLAVHGRRGRQRARPVQDVRQRPAAAGRHMQHDQHRRRQIGRQSGQQGA